MIDQDGFRSNVGIIVANAEGKLLWAKRAGSQNAWQFPQGGMHDDESPIDAMYRELKEELGLNPAQVKVLAQSRQWLRYRLPVRFQRHRDTERCVGQKQKWFLLQLLVDDACVDLDASGHPEFDEWKWVDYWLPAKQVIFFKSQVYRKVLQEFQSLLPKTHV